MFTLCYPENAFSIANNSSPSLLRKVTKHIRHLVFVVEFMSVVATNTFGTFSKCDKHLKLSICRYFNDQLTTNRSI